MMTKALDCVTTIVRLRYGWEQESRLVKEKKEKISSG